MNTEPGSGRQTFRARCLAWKWGETSTGKPQLAATLKLDTPKQEMVPFYGLCHDDEAIKRTVRAMRAMGWDGKGPITKATGLDRKMVAAVVEDTEYEGRAQRRVAWVNELAPPVKAELADKAADDLDARAARIIGEAQNGAHDEADYGP